MSIWIKICGNANPTDALKALELGADAVGFVFAASPREVTQARASEIVSLLPPEAARIGVFVDAGATEILKTVRTCGLTGVQLHGARKPGFATHLRALLGPHTQILQVLRFDALTAASLKAYTGTRDFVSVNALLIDSSTATAQGGTGQSFDWKKAATLLRGIGKPIVVAGGLNAENVGEAIRTLQPWGVDAVSGVESSPGVKDHEKLAAFIRAARAAG